DRKRAIFHAILNHLRPGGWYVNYDPVRAPTEAVEAIWKRVNDRYDPEAPYKRTHLTPQEQARHENHIRYMIPLEPQLSWLAEAGCSRARSAPPHRGRARSLPTEGGVGLR